MVFLMVRLGRVLLWGVRLGMLVRLGMMVFRRMRFGMFLVVVAVQSKKATTLLLLVLLFGSEKATLLRLVLRDAVVGVGLGLALFGCGGTPAAARTAWATANDGPQPRTIQSKASVAHRDSALAWPHPQAGAEVLILKVWGEVDPVWHGDG